MRANIGEPGKEKDRFRISDTGVGVAWEQLDKVNNLDELVSFRHKDKIMIEGLQSQDGADQYAFEIQSQPFRIIQRVNGEITTIVNHKDTLYYEVLE